MKKLQIFVIALMIFESTGLICMSAEKNYQDAIFAARNCDGSDGEIESTMYQYGFIVDAYDTNEPTMIEKINAKFNR